MPKNMSPAEIKNTTATELQGEIIAAVPGVNRTYAKRCAYRMKRAADRHEEKHDFYTALRILGLISDTTARDAVSNLEKELIPA